MEIRALAIADVKLLTTQVHRDERGAFSETYSRRRMAAAGVPTEFVQDNHALSVVAGTLRGLHFQVPPHAQGKLIRVPRGAIFDVAVDIRVGSPSFGQHVSEVLSADNWKQMWVPPGFAHGYCTLEPNTEVIYKVTEYYEPAFDRGLRWDDASLGIQWPMGCSRITLSEKDRRQPRLRELAPVFVYEA